MDLGSWGPAANPPWMLRFDCTRVCLCLYTCMHMHVHTFQHVCVFFSYSKLLGLSFLHFFC